MSRKLIAALLLLVACGPAQSGGPEGPRRGPLQPDPEVAAAATADFETLREAFLSWYLEAYPVRASELGVHEYDSALPDWDRGEVQLRIDDLLDWLADLEAIPLRAVQGTSRYDYAVLEFALRGELLDLEEVRSWSRNPRLYTTTLARALATVVERENAPFPDRLAALRSRLTAGPPLLEDARRNVTAAPHLWTDLAIEEARDLTAFLETGLEETLAAQGGASTWSLPPDLAEPRDALVDALVGYIDWLRSDLRERAPADYRLGRYLFERKLLYDEHIVLSVPELERLNEAAIAEYRERLEAAALEIDPQRSPQAILDSLAGVHPEPDRLVDEARSVMVALRDWLAGADVVTVVDGALPAVREAPAYARSEPALLDAAGPLGSGEGRAFYFITLPSPDWSAERAAAHMASFSPASLVGLTAHETFPGRAVQAGHERNAESRLRQAFTPRSLVDGWGHYAEGLAMEGGFGGDDPVLRLGAAHRALRMHARWYAATHLHALGSSLDEVVQRFMEIAYVDEPIARREVVRGTWDPGYLADALGRTQLEELRDDYRDHLEDEDGTFRPRDFHDRVLDLALPLPLAREVLIPMSEEEPDPRTRRR